MAVTALTLAFSNGRACPSQTVPYSRWVLLLSCETQYSPWPFLSSLFLLFSFERRDFYDAFALAVLCLLGWTERRRSHGLTNRLLFLLSRVQCCVTLWHSSYSRIDSPIAHYQLLDLGNDVVYRNYLLVAATTTGTIIIFGDSHNELINYKIYVSKAKKLPSPLVGRHRRHSRQLHLQKKTMTPLQLKGHGKLNGPWCTISMQNNTVLGNDKLTALYLSNIGATEKITQICQLFRAIVDSIDGAKDCYHSSPLAAA